MSGINRRSIVLCCGAAFSFALAASAARAEDYTLSSDRSPSETSQVEVLLEVGGDLSLKNEQEKRLETLKMSVVGTMVYDERVMSAPDADPRGVRQYRRCEAVIKIDKGNTKPRLRDERRRVALAPVDGETKMFSLGGPLTREELDLITLPASSLLIERLLPDRAVSPGDEWQHDEQLIAQLLDLDAVRETTVKSTFKEVTATSAQLELAGTVHGATDGVASDLELKGRYKYDLQSHRITWVALLIKEHRGIGPVAPGVDVTARLQMKITPHSTCPELSDEALADASLDPQPEALLLEYESAPGRYRFLHDRAWHVVNEAEKSVALRLIDRGELVAQCNVSALAPVAPGKRFTLEKFQEDVQRALGKHFDKFTSAGESTNSAGHNTSRVIAVGAVDDLPIQWNYYLVADDQGNQLVLAFTLEPELEERFGRQDESLLSTIEFLGRPDDTAAQPTLAPTR